MTLEEFHNITPIENIPSILEHGILSNHRSSGLPHSTVALEEVQEKRRAVRVPNGFLLHEYANVYFHARNPMMSRRRDAAQSLCVLRISADILQIPDAVITDQNAASRYVRFYPATSIGVLDLDYIFAPNWKHPDDQIEEWRHSSAKCAEALIPHKIPQNYLLGAYMVGDAAKRALEASGFGLPITVNADLFFH